MDERRYRQAEARLFADAGIEPVERWVELPTLGTRTRVLDVGEGLPTVFLHGGPAAAATWSYVARSASGVRSLLVERPGTGLSAPPPSTPTPLTLRAYLEQLTVDVLDALGLDRVALVGSSLGGYAALCAAATHPDRVERVVLAGCPPFVPGWRQPAFFSLLRAPVVGTLLLAAPVTRAVARLSLQQLGHGRSLAAGRIPEPMIEWTRAWQRYTATMRNDAAMIRACGTWRGGFDARLELDDGDLASVTSPCLAIAGTDDPVGGEDVVSGLVARLPAATVETWTGAGHLPWLDDAPRAGEAITRFMAYSG